MNGRRLILVLAAIGLGAVASGCGADPEPQSPEQFTPHFEPSPDSPRGGTLRVLTNGDLGPLDPGRTISQSSFIITFATKRTLLAKSPESKSWLMPDLADRMPEVDAKHNLLKVRLRDGVRFSPPVDREVRADDIKYAIERALLPGIANGQVEIYLGSLVGFDQALRVARRNPRRAPDIAGITTPTDDRLVLRFAGPVPFLAKAVFSLPVTSPVPRSFARRFDREIPSEYSDHVASTGPYMIARNEAGDLTGDEPGTRISLVRNPNWNPETDFRPAYLDQIEVEIGYANLQAASEKILAGESMVNGDFRPTPLALKEAASEYPEQLTLASSTATTYASLNTRVPPFDDPDVRRAVIAATDRSAMKLAAGGEFAGQLATHFLPPSIEGFEQAGGAAGPGFDFLAEPEGDPQLAADYMRRAGYPSGRYEGEARPVMVTSKTTQGREFAEILRQALDSLGIEVDLVTVSRDTMYSSWCNVPAKGVGVCPDVGWVGLFGDGQTMLDATFNGAAILPVNNSNWSLLDDPRVNRAIAHARSGANRKERAKRWGRVDRMVTGLAPAVPILWPDMAFLSSSNVNFVLESSAITPALPMISLEDG